MKEECLKFEVKSSVLASGETILVIKPKKRKRRHRVSFQTYGGMFRAIEKLERDVRRVLWAVEEYTLQNEDVDLHRDFKEAIMSLKSFGRRPYLTGVEAVDGAVD